MLLSCLLMDITTTNNPSANIVIFGNIINNLGVFLPIGDTFNIKLSTSMLYYYILLTVRLFSGLHS